MIAVLLAIAPVLATPDAVDVATAARPLEARVTNVELELVADFAKKQLSGTATLSVLAQKNIDTIVLDTRDLNIDAVTDDKGRALKWSLGAPHDDDAPLTVQLARAKRIVVRYATSPGAAALQWLSPGITAGKVKPYLFSQGEANLNRSWIPTQDSPGIRQTWSARITVPPGLVAVMSAEMKSHDGKAVPGGRRFSFRMEHPVPPYLIALAVGDLAFRPLGPRTGVWTEPSMLERSAAELVDTEAMVKAAEALYGTYRWGRYEVLVMPPSFPFGGMENPRLTFLTPTVIAGDRSQVGVIAHELAHSWSGNLVTNATWSDSWLNEGFTTYFENRIMERVYGQARAAVEADLSWDHLQRALKQLGPTAPGTRLHGKPFDGELDYEKGADFLRTLEHELGRERFDAWLRAYFDRHAFQPQTTAGLLADLRANVVRGDAALEKKLDLDTWVYLPGLPANAVHVSSPELAKADDAATAFATGASAASLPTHGWTTDLWRRFVSRLPVVEAPAQLRALDAAFAFSTSTNAEVRCDWLHLAIANRYEPALASAAQLLAAQGRGKFVVPTYEALLAQGEWGTRAAYDIYARTRAGYHPIVVERVDMLMKKASVDPARVGP